ncbi:MAG: winged helix-turn-helix domain-containing protein [Archaeoglobaceae archaeon]
MSSIPTDKKIKILESLKERKKTISELSKELRMSKSSVYEHLAKLTAVGFVRRKETGRKWVYYELTEKGLNFIRSEIWKLIAVVSVISIGSSVLLMFDSLWKYENIRKVEYRILEAETTDVGLQLFLLIFGISLLILALILRRSALAERFR